MVLEVDCRARHAPLNELLKALVRHKAAGGGAGGASRGYSPHGLPRVGDPLAAPAPFPTLRGLIGKRTFHLPHVGSLPVSRKRPLRAPAIPIPALLFITSCSSFT
jgi:hypothetical protein